MEQAAHDDTNDLFYVRTDTAKKTQTFGGNVIYMHKGATQPTRFPTATLDITCA